MRILFFLFLCSFSFISQAQQGILRGKVTDAINNDAIIGAVVVLQNTELGGKTDLQGQFEITGIKAGLYNVEVSYVGYRKKVLYEIAVDNAKATYVDITLEKRATEIKEVKVTTRKDKNEESPLSLRTIGVNEIQRNPGGNRDISKVIQSLPGAGSSVGFRNDIIIRGGGPSENRFYLDGMEIPNINHFATQGANGGPVGILNVDFLQDVGFYSGAFPANRGNTLSSVFDFKQKNPRSDNWHAAFTVGSSDIGLRAEGPVNEKSGLMLSVRRSYLKFLFTALELPFLPTYNDVQLKYKYKFNQKNELTFLMLGAYDVAVLNTKNNETETQQYILDNLPEQKQWSYTTGLVYKHYRKKSFQTIVVSRNMFDNYAFKYPGNVRSVPMSLSYKSQEIENKFRAEHSIQQSTWKFNMGLNAEYVKYANKTYNELSLPNGQLDTIRYSSAIAFIKYGLFAQASQSWFDEALSLSLGVRADGNNYTSAMKNPFTQLSPRLSASYKFNKRWSLNANAGLYYQTPTYTMLGYKDSQEVYVNKASNIRYIQCAHIVGGIEYNTRKNARITVESFYKKYQYYPQSVQRGISLANAGGDFGVVGNEAVNSVSEGRTYGVELFAQQKLYQGFYGLLAVTLFRSEFTNANKSGYTASAWDQRYIINLTAGKKLPRNWEIGAKFRLTGGRPYTPFDTSLSSITYVWDVSKKGQYDYSKINESRLPLNHQLDIRVDKKYFKKHWTLNVFLDIQNVYKFAAKDQEYLTVVRDANGNPQLDPNGGFPPKYQVKFLDNSTGTVVPTLGIIIEY